MKKSILESPKFWGVMAILLAVALSVCMTISTRHRREQIEQMKQMEIEEYIDTQESLDRTEQPPKETEVVETSPTYENTYAQYTVKELLDSLAEDKVNAVKIHRNEDVEITGYFAIFNEKTNAFVLEPEEISEDYDLDRVAESLKLVKEESSIEDININELLNLLGEGISHKVLCYNTDKDMVEFLKNISRNQRVVVKGKISGVDDLIGYQIIVEDIDLIGS